LERLYNHGDDFVLNVSSPNTPNLRRLQNRELLELLLQTVMAFVKRQAQVKPIALKIAPDLGWEQLDEILELAHQYGVAAIIATNTTLARDGLHTDPKQQGGLSGQPLKARSLEILHYLVHHSKLPTISVGGIGSPEDAHVRLEAGATLVQLYSGFVFAGPLLPRHIARSLCQNPAKL
ncbi:MAG: dihydroorotate dehydrogenase (quinone), partial [Deinococcales bacterium]